MDQSPGSRPSGIPRPSRLPVPTAGLRASASRENLQQSARLSIANPRLRATPSRERLLTSASASLSSSSKPRVPSTPPKPRDTSARDRDVSGSMLHNPKVRQPLRKPSREALSRKSSRQFLREGSLRPEVVEEDQRGPSAAATILEETDTLGSSRKPRPSLSERTMETLHSIPSSPAIKNRTSSFFRSESPMRPTSSGAPNSRPGSSYDTSMRPPSRAVSSRPTSSSESSIPLDFRASTNTFRPPNTTFQSHTPLKKPTTAKSLNTPSNIRTNQPFAGSSSSRLPSPNFGSSMRERSPSPIKPPAIIPSTKSGSKTLSSRPLKTRASINGLFRKPSMPALNPSAGLDRIGFVPKTNSTTFSSASSENALSEANSNASKISRTSTAPTSSGDDRDTNPRKSSMALRDQIAKAKAAKRATAKKATDDNLETREEVSVIPSGTFDFGLSDDPFNQNLNKDSAKGLLRKRIDSARQDGRLNIAAMGLKEVPEEVMQMYSLDAVGSGDGSWAESVDLTRFVAADNEFETIADNVFPDIDPREAADMEDAPGNQFGGLETLDLHGNSLIALPPGLRRLELLTTLNLSNNKLNNDCFQIVSQISSLRDLKIIGNELTGPLPTSIASLRNLERLELQRNSLTSFPSDLAALSRLRVINITENKFTSLPFDVLRRFPLTELLAAKNNLSGVLIDAEVDELPHLQILDVTANSLTSITASESLKLPSLHQLNCSANRLTRLPDVTSWIALLNVAAEDNNIESLPDGFVTLEKVKSVDFSGNNIKTLDYNIGGMDSLDVFRISGNPLKEKKFSSMSTDDLKRALKARMTPVEPHAEDKDVDADGSFYSASGSPVTSRPPSAHWPVKPGGVLDRSNTHSHSLNPVIAAEMAATNAIKTLELHHNNFKEIPNSIEFFAATLTTLDLAHNELDIDKFMNDDLDLPALKELNLSSNTFNSLQPLIQHLKAPQLERLDISFNRLTTLPPLKSHFPSLITLLASNNTIRELSPESVKGLRSLDCSSNDINSLNARIGLLGGPGGLEWLDVKGNRFRVPKYTILEKGTEATLAWLRDRIPAGSPSPTDVD